jgi:hypothetical protein
MAGRTAEQANGQTVIRTNVDHPQQTQEQQTTAIRRRRTGDSPAARGSNFSTAVDFSFSSLASRDKRAYATESSWLTCGQVSSIRRIRLILDVAVAINTLSEVSRQHATLSKIAAFRRHVFRLLSRELVQEDRPRSR